MVHCQEFRENYSDFRDGLMSTPRMEALQAHLDACSSCARYDRVVQQGAALLRDLPPVRLSDDFMPRLQHRLYHLDDELAVQRGRASDASVPLMVAIAAAMAAIAWLPTARPRPPVVQLPPAVAHAPHPPKRVPVLFRTGPLLTPGAGATDAVDLNTLQSVRLDYPAGERYTLLRTQLSQPR